MECISRIICDPVECQVIWGHLQHLYSERLLTQKTAGSRPKPAENYDLGLILIKHIWDIFTLVVFKVI